MTNYISISLLSASFVFLCSMLKSVLHGFKCCFYCIYSRDFTVSKCRIDMIMWYMPAVNVFFYSLSYALNVSLQYYTTGNRFTAVVKVFIVILRKF